jgi:hypothetical protein
MELLSLLPNHEQYSEALFSAGGLFFRKAPCPHETINDVHGIVADLFHVLREARDDFLHVAADQRYTEAALRNPRQWRTEDNPVERVWRWCVVARQALPSESAWAWACAPAADVDWVRRVEGLAPLLGRLQRTQIMACPWQRAMERTDTAECLHYLDAEELPGGEWAGMVEYLITAELEGKIMLVAPVDLPSRGLEKAGWAQAPLPDGRVVWLNPRAVDARGPRQRTLWEAD